MSGDIGYPPHDNALERCTPVLHIFNFQPRHREAISHRLRCQLNGHKFSKPLEAYPHDFPSVIVARSRILPS